MIYSFTIPGRLPSLNELISKMNHNRFAGAKFKKDNTQLCALAATTCKTRGISSPCDIHITWYEQNRKRDKDNVQSGIKFILDGLVTAGVLNNDGWAWIGRISHDVILDRENPRIDVKLTEIMA